MGVQGESLPTSSYLGPVAATKCQLMGLAPLSPTGEWEDARYLLEHDHHTSYLLDSLADLLPAPLTVLSPSSNLPAHKNLFLKGHPPTRTPPPFRALGGGSCEGGTSGMA